MRLTRVTLFFITLIMGLEFYRLTDYLLEDLEAQTLQATEESMIDSSQLLANFVENDQDLTKVFKGIKDRRFEARIFAMSKTEVGIDAYLTDREGIVLFDSGNPENVGKDFSNWTDVQPPFSPMDTPNLRYSRPFRQKQIPSSRGGEGFAADVCKKGGGQECGEVEWQVVHGEKGSVG